MKKIHKMIIASTMIIVFIAFIGVNILWIDYSNAFKPLVEGYDNLEKFYMKTTEGYSLTQLSQFENSL